MPLKTINELNQIFYEQQNEEAACEQKTLKPRLPGFRIVSDILFYLAIIVILYSVLSTQAGGEKPRSIMGYSYFTVMSSSMKDEIPKGSLILIRHTQPNRLKPGDNITFMREGGITVTHKIIDIYEDYSTAGGRTFQTKGVNNANPDPYIVSSSDVLGKVVLTLPGVGAFIIAVSENIHIILIIFLLFSLLSFLLRGIGEKRRHKTT